MPNEIKKTTREVLIYLIDRKVYYASLSNDEEPEFVFLFNKNGTWLKLRIGDNLYSPTLHTKTKRQLFDLDSEKVFFKSYRELISLLRQCGYNNIKLVMRRRSISLL